jgi:hypothetical protein
MRLAILSGAKLKGGAVWFASCRSQKSAKSDEISDGWPTAGGSCAYHLSHLGIQWRSWRRLMEC